MSTSIPKTPIVQFDYPDSESNNMRIRYVQVVEVNHTYLKGYEIDNPHSTNGGKFKQYKKSRIATNGIVLISY